MTSKEAIDILIDLSLRVFIDKSPDLKAAITLGIEALKSHQVALDGFKRPDMFLLRGETLDQPEGGALETQ